MPHMVGGRLSKFEAHIQRLVEGSFARLFAGHLHPRDIAVQLARALEDNALPDATGDLPLAPSHYAVLLNPDDYEAIINQQPELAQHLAGELVELARAGDYQLIATPSVQILPEAAVKRHASRVTAHHAADLHEPTEDLETLLPSPDAEAAALGATLAIAGKQSIPLDRALINVGRHRENHIIVDDNRVSRRHAQLRLRNGRFFVFDLDSQTGTFVNGGLIQESALQHGDVIAIGGTRLVYTAQQADLPGPPQADTSSGQIDETEAHPPVGPA